MLLLYAGVAQAQAPTVSSVSIISTPASGETYGRGEIIEVEVEFTDEVRVSGEPPQLALTIGAQTRRASCSAGCGGSPTERLAFRYIVRAPNTDDDGISIPADAIRLNGGAIEQVGTSVNAVLTHDAVSDDSNHKVDGSQVTTPTVRSVVIASTPESGDTYQKDEDIRVRVEFTTAVEVSGELQLALTIGAQTRRASCSAGCGGSPTERLAFDYSVQASDLDANGISIAADALSLPQGSSITLPGDNNTNAALTHDAVADGNNHKVDGRPMVSEVSIVSSPTSGDTYERGETIRVEVEFTDDVRASGTPQLALAIGTQTRQAACYSGCGGSTTSSLRFEYVVQSSDDDDDGISIGANALRLPQRKQHHTSWRQHYRRRADPRRRARQQQPQGRWQPSDHADGKFCLYRQPHRPAAIPTKEARRLA